jgi:hypothetical protein
LLFFPENLSLSGSFLNPGEQEKGTPELKKYTRLSFIRERICRVPQGNKATVETYKNLAKKDRNSKLWPLLLMSNSGTFDGFPRVAPMYHML